MNSIARAKPPPDAPRRRVLIVEDDQTVLDLLGLHLRNAGYDVLAAADAVVAGQRLLDRSQTVDLLIVDAHLPYMTGIDFVATVLADTTLPVIPTMIITGHKDLAERARVLDVPCLVKPFSVDQFLTLVKATVQAGAQAAEARLGSGKHDATRFSGRA